jgi:O-antigen/teichoic acid export membrane protein
MLGFFDSSNAVAYYSASQSFLSVVLLVGTSVATITFPSFSSWHSKGNVQEIRKVTLQAERYLTMFGLPICALLVLFPTEIAVALFGPDFVEAGGPMRWLGVATFLSLVNAVHASQINAVNRPDLNAKLTFLQFLVFVPLLFVLIPSSLLGVPMLGLSYLGASLAYLITTVVIFAVTRWMVLKLTGTSSNPRLLVQLVAAALTALALFLLEGLLPIEDWMVLLLYVLMALGLFSGLLFLFRELSMDDARYLLDVLNPAKMMRYSVDEVRSKPKR